MKQINPGVQGSNPRKVNQFNPGVEGLNPGRVNQNKPGCSRFKSCMVNQMNPDGSNPEYDSKCLKIVPEVSRDPKADCGVSLAKLY